MAPSRSLIPSTEGRPFADVLSDVRVALEHIRNAACGQSEIDAQRADALKATLVDARRILRDLDEEEGLSLDESRLLKALGRSEASFDLWADKLKAKEKAALRREKERLMQEAEVTRDLQPITYDDPVEGTVRDMRGDVAQIVSDMKDISEMNQHINAMMAEQGEELTTTQENVEAVATETNKGLKEMQGAVKYSYSTTGSYVGLCAAMVAGSTAAVAGLAVAPIVGVAAVGGLTGRYVGKKIAKKAVSNATMHLDAHIESNPSGTHPA
eukprot:TRINITY_DN24674_c0_g1_i1.p1 TRINITY_DN24674_c0_g1~~TRINITY_DN24674_c0_g1_i1.p1  ORF type:complete len:269 (+),score=116.37 TRINITY_DN24674_c0_g1_i1:137-943(+)